MKSYFTIIFSIITLVFVIISCNSENAHKPLYKGESEGPPLPVSNVKAQSLHGKVKITYDLPKKGFQDILYVEAVWKSNDGTNKVKKSSRYQNTILLKGFNNTDQYNVRLITVNHANEKSKPVDVKVKALTPAYLAAINSIQISKSFGGIKVKYNNKYHGELKIAVLTNDSITGNLTDIKSVYTKKDHGEFFVIGYPPKQRKFGVYVRNQYLAYSDTVFKKITPLFEEKIPKKTWQEFDLPTDDDVQHFCCNAAFDNLWDGIIGFSNKGIFHTLPGSVIPQWYTIDLGEKVIVDRWKLWDRADKEFGAYSGADPKIIELWGSMDPNSNGAYDSTWTKLGRFVSTKPSGLPGNQFTDQDYIFGTEKGHPFRVKDPLDKPAFRYLRIKVIKTWGGLQGNGVNMAEITLWGRVFKTYR